jgi:protoporphyrinogen oxidase
VTGAEVQVLGAGPAGLIAGWHAARRGHAVTIVEQAPVVGGMAGSFEVAGQRVDHGSHRLHPSIDPGLLAELRGLLGADLQERPRRGRIRLADRWIAFPLRTTDLVRRLPPSFALRAGMDALTRPFRRVGGDTYADEVRAGLGPTMADAFYGPYARKLWDTDPSQLSGDLARRRIGARSPAALLRRLVRPTTTFLYPRRGYGQISEALADAAVAAGAELRLSTPAESVRPSAERHTWSTLPLTTLAGMCDPPGPDAALDHRALVLVYLVVDRPEYTPFDAHYFPGLDTPMSRLSEPKNYRASSDDPSGHTVLCAEVPCWVGDDAWSASPEHLGCVVAESLERNGLPAPMHVAVEVRRLPRVYPVYRVGYEAGLAELEAWVDSRPNLVSLGRQGRFVPDNLHHVLAMGRDAAAALGDDGRFDVAAWRRARERFGQHVVED